MTEQQTELLGLDSAVRAAHLKPSPPPWVAVRADPRRLFPSTLIRTCFSDGFVLESARLVVDPRSGCRYKEGLHLEGYSEGAKGRIRRKYRLAGCSLGHANLTNSPARQLFQWAARRRKAKGNPKGTGGRRATTLRRLERDIAKLAGRRPQLWRTDRFWGQPHYDLQARERRREIGAQIRDAIRAGKTPAEWLELPAETWKGAANARLCWHGQRHNSKPREWTAGALAEWLQSSEWGEERRRDLREEISLRGQLRALRGLGGKDAE